MNLKWDKLCTRTFVSATKDLLYVNVKQLKTTDQLSVRTHKALVAPALDHFVCTVFMIWDFRSNFCFSQLFLTKQIPDFSSSPDLYEQ